MEIAPNAVLNKGKCIAYAARLQFRCSKMYLSMLKGVFPSLGSKFTLRGSKPYKFSMKGNELTTERKRGFMALTWIKWRWKPSIESIAIKNWSLGEKTGSELQNANGNYWMVKMNSKIIFNSHLIIFKLHLLLWL